MEAGAEGDVLVQRHEWLLGFGGGGHDGCEWVLREEVVIISGCRGRVTPLAMYAETKGDCWMAGCLWFLDYFFFFRVQDGKTWV